ncbi:hypothetical protein MRX96_004469 [Rhipicephalus microplus]
MTRANFSKAAGGRVVALQPLPSMRAAGQEGGVLLSSSAPRLPLRARATASDDVRRNEKEDAKDKQEPKMNRGAATREFTGAEFVGDGGEEERRRACFQLKGRTFEAKA